MVLQLNEKVNIDKLRIIVDNVESLYKSGALGRFKDASNGYKQITDLRTISTIMKKSYEFYKSGEAQTYAYVKDIDFGRLFAQNKGLQSFSRRLRSTVAKGLYWDLDIVNCHPMLVSQWCEENEVPCPILNAYIDNREPFLRELVAYNHNFDRDDAKTVPLVLLNNGPIFCDCPQWVTDFQEEMAGIHEAFITKRSNKGFVDRATKRNPDNIKGSALNYWLCKTENEILQCIIKKVSETHEIGVLCFDGLMIYIKDTPVDIPSVEEYIFEQTGYRLSLKIKDFDDEINLDGYEIKHSIVEELLESIERNETLTHMCVCDIFYKSYKGNLFYIAKDEWIQYNQITGKWSLCDADSIIYFFMRTMGNEFITYINSLIPPEEKEELKKFKKHKSFLLKEANKLETSCFAKKVINSSKPLFEETKVMDRFDNHPNLFCFSNNKAFDLETGEVKDIVKEMMILTDCGYPYKERVQGDIDEVMKFIRDIQPESDVESFLSMLSAGLYGKNTDQFFYINTGKGANGKSLLQTLYSKCLGNYFRTFNVDQLTMRSSGPDSANSGLCALRGSRIACSSEPADSESSKIKLQIDKIKFFTGDLKTEVRDLHKTVSDLRFTWTNILFCNEIPELSKADEAIQRRLQVFNYPYKFVDNPVGDFQKKRDYSLTNKFERCSELHIAFFFILADTWKKYSGHFKPSQSVINETEDYFKKQNPMNSFFQHCTPSCNFVRQKEVLTVFHEFCKATQDFKNHALVTEKSIRKYIELGKFVVTEDKKNGNKIFIDLTKVHNEIAISKQ